MTEAVLRLGLTLAVIAVAAGIAFLARKTVRVHPAVDIAGAGLPPGIVVFTSTDCGRCKEVLASARSFDVPLREVTYELESDLQQRVGVVGVPLTLVIDRSGNLIEQIAGPAKPRTIRRALTQAGF